VIAGIKNTAPSTTPRPAAIETIHARILRGVLKAWAEHRLGPAFARRCEPAQQSLQADRQHHDQHQRQSNDRHRMERIGGDRICESA